jgi:hypothetical protein
MNINVANNEQVIESPAQKKHNDGLMETVKYLREQAKTEGIGILLADERLILSHTLEFAANSLQEKNSLKSAIAQLDEARKCFENLLANPEAYKENVVDAYSTKKKPSGLPLDVAREFFQSHNTRLDNLLSGKSPHFEKLLVMQRKENLRIMKDAYIELQRKALGLPKKSQDKGMGR